MLPELTLREQCVLVWSLAQLRYRPPPLWLGRMRQLVRRHAEELLEGEDNGMRDGTSRFLRQLSRFRLQQLEQSLDRLEGLADGAELRDNAAATAARAEEPLPRSAGGGGDARDVYMHREATGLVTQAEVAWPGGGVSDGSVGAHQVPLPAAYVAAGGAVRRRAVPRALVGAATAAGPARKAPEPFGYSAD